MISYKSIELRDLRNKYGQTHRGLFAVETINPGEKIFSCDCRSKDSIFTRQQLLDIANENANLKDFVIDYSYMVDDDLYKLAPVYFNELNNDCMCVFFNHSCDPNCGFDGSIDTIRALRTIYPGDELTYHYGFMETEQSFINNLKCQCSSSKCSGKILFSVYRDKEFVKKYYDYFSQYLKYKADHIKEKWHNTNCYVKRIPSDDECSNWKKILCALTDIKKDELVATFSSDEIEESKHYLGNSLKPNCYVKGRDVFANVDIPSETELTVYYHGVLL